MQRVILGLLTVGFILSACRPAAKESQETPSTSAATRSSVPLAKGWSPVALEEAEGAALERLTTARAAKKKLGSTLKQQLTASIGEGDYVRGIEVCKSVAPSVPQAVKAANPIQSIGRTSLRLRNPGNRPPEWAKPVVEANVAQELLLKGPENRYGYLAPIRLGEVCVHCHGQPSQIPDAVQAKLKEEYPEDKALGFAPGDLRGWFWVEL